MAGVPQYTFLVLAQLATPAPSRSPAAVVAPASSSADTPAIAQPRTRLFIVVRSPSCRRRVTWSLLLVLLVRQVISAGLRPSGAGSRCWA
ncbi:hypothetical protein C0Q58_07990 [Streptomyces albidoflavus]|nr:hypothetical protein C0Q58_07990 [Streptomyces albidoflavus]